MHKKTVERWSPWLLLAATILLWQIICFDLPRPRDLEVTYTKEFTDIVHELRGHIGALRQGAGKAGAPIPQ